MAVDDRLGPYFGFQMVNDPLMEISQGKLNTCAERFLEGWRRGLAEFWNVIKEKL
jgi:hypothetical protein